MVLASGSRLPLASALTNRIMSPVVETILPGVHEVSNSVTSSGARLGSSRTDSQFSAVTVAVAMKAFPPLPTCAYSPGRRGAPVSRSAAPAVPNQVRSPSLLSITMPGMPFSATAQSMTC
ncbi:hypothetical protein [Nocardia sp. IFM 10818]